MIMKGIELSKFVLVIFIIGIILEMAEIFTKVVVWPLLWG